MVVGIAVVAAAVVTWIVFTENSFTRKEIKMQEALSGIEVALTKRYDVLTKMLAVTREYAEHEKKLILQTVHLRKGMSVDEMDQAEKQMDEIVHTIGITAEAYPELRSSEVFRELEKSICDVEEHLQAARRLYNASVTGFNTAIAMFPGKLLAGNRTAKPFFEADEEKENDVAMKF